VSEEPAEWDTGRPAYKEHPLWNDAMALTQAAYGLAERMRPGDPGTARRLRRAAVAIPAHVAGALSTDDESRRDHVLTALIALAEVSRRAESVEGAERAAAADLARRAAELERAVCFELGDAGTRVS
jgi:hypothetical protein